MHAHAEKTQDRKDKSVANIKSKEVAKPKENKTGLPDNLKSGIESISGIDMSSVQVKRNSAEPAKVGAHAYAQGNQIHLGPGQDKHLPHEAWHVVQQAQGRVKPTTSVNGKAVNDNPGLEKEADVMGVKALQMRSTIVTEIKPDQVEVNNVAQFQDGLRRRKVDGVVDEKIYTIEARARPVMGIGGVLATHTFIVLIEGSKIVDSLSFDPSNSIGLKDASPNDSSKGSATVATNANAEDWQKLKDAFGQFASKKYDLGNCNCTHAVSWALSAGPDFPGRMSGITLAVSANKTWDWIHSRQSAMLEDKKNK